MARIGVVTDSTADFTSDTNADGIVVVPLVVNWDGQTFRDKVDLTTSAFYERLRASKSLPRTGAPSLAGYEEAYRTLLADHDAVVNVALASKVSATYDVGRQAAETVDPARIFVVDSGTFTACLAWLAEEAVRMGQQGAAPEETVRRLDALKVRMRIYCTLETLDFLQRGGRIGRARALAGTLLNVKPILIIRDGEVSPLERVRTSPAAIRRLVEIVTSLGPLERIAVLQGGNPAGADELERQLAPRLPGQRLERGEIGTVLGTHGGPGVVGAALLLAE